MNRHHTTEEDAVSDPRTDSFPPPPASSPPPWQPEGRATPEAPAGLGDGWGAAEEAGTVLGDVVAVYSDVRSGVRGPTLVAHVASLLVDVAALGPLVPIWELLPAAIATPLTVGLGVVAVLGHLAAWYLAAEKANQHHEAAAAGSRVVYRRVS